MQRDGQGGGQGDGADVGVRQGCIRREGASEAAPEAMRQAVEGGCQSGWGGYCRLQMPLRLALGVRGTVAGHRLGALDPPSPPMHHWGRGCLARNAMGTGGLLLAAPIGPLATCTTDSR